MLYLKYTLQRDKILMSKTGMGSVYDAYYHTLFYLNRHEKMNLEVKKEIIERICLDHIIYCNYYYGEILSQLKNVESAEKKLEQAFIQLFDIIKNAPRDLFNGGYAARWCEIGTGLVSYKTKNEKIIQMQTMLIDYL